MAEKKNRWKIGFWVVFGLLVVITFYLLYCVGTYKELSQQYCEDDNQVIRLYNSATDLIKLYNPASELTGLDEWNCS